MDKKELVKLLQKEIKELELLTEGFDDMPTIPKALLSLASEKSVQITQKIEQLNKAQENVNPNFSFEKEKKEISTFKEEKKEEVKEEKKEEKETQKTEKSTRQIQKMIGIGDRFHFLRELFNNDKEKMQKTYQQLNALENYTVAERYLLENNSWDMENETVQLFFTIVGNFYK